MRGSIAVAIVLVVAAIPLADGAARTIAVGPAGEFRTIADAAKAAVDGDVVEIQAGTYTGDVATWTASGLTIRGVGGRPVLDAAGAAAEGKAIWVIKGDDVLVEGIAFVNARVPDRNGAGIRHEGGTLTVRDSLFRDNEEGILTQNDRPQRLIIENSEFRDNGIAGGAGGQVHGVYAGHIAEVVVRGSLFIGTKIGHHLKSRAERTIVACNRFADGAQGTASFAIDLPETGDAIIMGNTFHKGVGADNPHTIAYGNEGVGNKGRTLVVVFNTFVDDRASSPFVRVREANGIQAHISNNIFVGRNDIAVNAEATEPNLHVAGEAGQDLIGTVTDLLGLAGGAGLVDVANHDYRLAPGSAAIDAGVENAAIDGELVMPDCEYVDPVGTRPRPRDGPPDLGAYEYAGP